MSMIANAPKAPALSRRKNGATGFFGRLIHCEPKAYEARLQERDMIMITATLLRLKERQLNRIGLSRATLALDVEDLALRAERDAQLTSEVLRIVEDDASESREDHRAIAAE
ncbi:MAG: hypothetical protein EA407_07025 [Rhodobacteraceae bacterium]|nr:MAG: hypothetical protein EA407_07025 [Paracoccaceae bacterium]